MNSDPEKNRVYMREYMKRRWQARRKVAIVFLGGACARCGSRESLEFDHRDMRKKRFTIAKQSSANEIAFWNEIRKCQLLCKSCHLKKSTEQQRKREARKRRQRVPSVAGDASAS